MTHLFPPLVAATLLLAPTFDIAARAEGGFHKRLTLQGVTFVVHGVGEGSMQQLSISTKGAKPPIQPIRQTVEGQVVGAEVADLNSNGLPEIYAFVVGAGSGSYGQLVAYKVRKGFDQLAPINLPQLSGAMAEGYQGHDQFSVVEGCLVRRFPIYTPGDANAKATGGERQICYKFKTGDADRTLQPTSILKL
ncbi:MAG: hypothetical protein VKP70_02195 [Cyanobacteriota bacterium]|nr:hypothetical protein [Cyanobacteriota bacterium]